MDKLPADAQRIEYARPKVLDDDVRAVHQPREDIAALLLLEVEHERPLVRVQIEERPAPLGMLLLVLERPQPASGIAAGPFDLDHVRAVVGEELGGVGAGDVVGQVENRQVVEGPCHLILPAEAWAESSTA